MPSDTSALAGMTTAASNGLIMPASATVTTTDRAASQPRSLEQAPDAGQSATQEVEVRPMFEEPALDGRRAPAERGGKRHRIVGAIPDHERVAVINGSHPIGLAAGRHRSGRGFAGQPEVGGHGGDFLGAIAAQNEDTPSRLDHARDFRPGVVTHLLASLERCHPRPIAPEHGVRASAGCRRRARRRRPTFPPKPPDGTVGRGPLEAKADLLANRLARSGRWFVAGQSGGHQGLAQAGGDGVATGPHQRGQRGLRVRIQPAKLLRVAQHE